AGLPSHRSVACDPRPVAHPHRRGPRRAGRALPRWAAGAGTVCRLPVGHAPHGHRVRIDTRAADRAGHPGTQRAAAGRPRRARPGPAGAGAARVRQRGALAWRALRDRGLRAGRRHAAGHPARPRAAARVPAIARAPRGTLARRAGGARMLFRHRGARAVRGCPQHVRGGRGQLRARGPETV
ncbi:MAG: hypothetical protein AVDCRST_MAG71-2050, partial [uncultured Lysobacter sp.]